ncbi:glycosyl transferase family 9 [Parvibaculum lavamentivorans DS-1]|uniref:Glycosyl transferase family 9 n=1 Tax=Parvibaculum lavamentivorans (strain DS-1 / DSM 13023 / NCIMB 13966) TaxID=402881 RepID=A7HR39_PARL1|nr:glycosyltransferase family 9 protein [Parvibaculum lavamentivorans]ABS62372.1 glycosyl transferase family 9 [Parvibaculum lavamentivorans DS-1]
MRVLFIASNRIGDAVLSTGLLGGLMERYPGAEFWVACGPLAVPVFSHAPGVTRIIVMRKEKRAGHWRKLLKATMFRRFEAVVDLRGSATAWALWTRKRHILKADHTLHRVVHNAQVAGFEPPPSPRVWPGNEMRARAAAAIPEGVQVLAMGPAAAWVGKMWPAERFAELARRLLAPGGAMEGAYLLVTGGPADRKVCEPVLEAVPADRRIDLIGAGIDETAAFFERIRLYVGNDSGLMHLAAAAGAPTIGLFGPSDDAIYAPWGPKTVAVRVPRALGEVRAAEDTEKGWHSRSHMEDLAVETVLDAAHALLAQTGASGQNAVPVPEKGNPS